MEKFAKKEVQYSPGKDGKYCGVCKHFEMPTRCEIVEGAINRMDWCNQFSLERKVKK